MDFNVSLLVVVYTRKQKHVIGFEKEEIIIFNGENRVCIYDLYVLCVYIICTHKNEKRNRSPLGEITFP